MGFVQTHFITLKDAAQIGIPAPDVA
jgi:hypothetical protein